MKSELENLLASNNQDMPAYSIEGNDNERSEPCNPDEENRQASMARMSSRDVENVENIEEHETNMCMDGIHRKEDVAEVGASNSLQDDTISALKIRLDEEHKEKKKLLREISELRKNTKEAEGKESAIVSLTGKLEKVNKLKDQMAAAVQTLKQDNSVLKAQVETHKSTSEAQKVTMESYKVIINNFESKVIEKDDVIKDLVEKSRSNEIGTKLHKDVAVRFMEEMSGAQGEDDSDEEEEYKKEMKNIYAKLREEETKVRNLEQENAELKKTILTKKIESEGESIKKQEEQELTTDALKKSKKEVKMLKDVISQNEKNINEQTHETITSPKNTDEMAKLLKEKEAQINDLTEHNQFTQDELKDKTKEAEDLSSNVKQLGTQNGLLTLKQAEMSQNLATAREERDAAVNSLEASRHEVSQLVGLNNQLKTANDKLSSEVKRLGDQKNEKLTAESTQRSNIRDGQKPIHKLDVNKPIDEVVLNQRLCYNELKEVGSCPWGKERCRFNHAIPQEVLRDKEKVLSIVGGKNLCVNEFTKKGSCIKGESCRFSHGITAEQLNSPVLQEVMKRKMERMKTPTNGAQKPVTRLCVHEFHQPGSCTWRERCKFSHEINEEQRNNVDIQNRMKSIKNPTPRNHQRNTENVVVPRNMLEEIWAKLENITQSMHFSEGLEGTKEEN